MPAVLLGPSDDNVFYKSILNEFAVKMNQERPTYNTVKQEQEGFFSSFHIDFGNYGLETVLSKIIKSKDKLYAALHKLKDTSHENISVVPQAVGVSIGQSFGQVSHELIDKIFCKSILNEFAIKMNQERPTYKIVKQEQEGFLPVFTSTLVFNGLYYTGEVGNSGSGTVLSEIIKSKDKLYAALHKLKDTSYENISAVPQAVGVSIGQMVNLPIEFVLAVLPEPSDVGPSSLKKRCKNKQKPN
ncbi:hypothetical protein CFP56_008704 [Quercus suber]|uniref:Uncharacterized protein n=1 Tax=Quercus suber TaxID=58331 RepID=A0AAW0M6W2_QUESU